VVFGQVWASLPAQEHLGLNMDCCDMTQENWKKFLLASAGNGANELEKLLEKPELVESNLD
jgi:hypothetical protein